MELDDTKVKIEVWDTVGQEKYGGLALSYYKSAMGIILGYSVDSRESFKNVTNWIKQISDKADSNISKILIGTKIDLSNRKVSYEEGRKLAESYGLRFFETSSKENYNVTEAFETIAKDIKRQYIDKNQNMQENQAGRESHMNMSTSVLSPGRLRLGTEDHRNKKCC